MTAKYRMRLSVALAAFAGLALRFFFVLKLPVTDSGDAPFYIELAWNWLKNGVYGAVVEGRLVPLDTRVPGYPAFLAAIFSVAGNSTRAVMFTQAFLDLATCFAIALIAARLAPAASRRRVALAGLWLAALCPFTANYTAVALTETLVIFLTSAAILLFVEAQSRASASAQPAEKSARGFSPWLLGGVLVGFGALVRPETPLLLAAAGVALLAKWWRPANWIKLARAGVLMAVGLLLPLLPWAARNYRSLHEVQFLTPRYLQMPDDFSPRGFDAWTATWLWKFGDVYRTLWNLNSAEIPVEAFPPQAFDTPDERARVAAMLADYNYTLTETHEQDAGFAQLARERTARHPLRTYLKIPLLRSLVMWFTPRVELLPNSSPLHPIRTEWDDDRLDFLLTLGLVLANILYIALALAGLCLAWRFAPARTALAFLVAFILIRTLYIASAIETPEPRYVLECFPAVIALAAQVFSAGSGKSVGFQPRE
jgi:4-amino-4-deoxy-L-arabinose transferase-like glycosyltransferase